MRESEQMKKLVDYFTRNLKKGYTIDSLKWALINQGYSKTFVDKAMIEANNELAKKAPILEIKPKIDYQMVDEYNQPLDIQKSWWKKLFGF